MNILGMNISRARAVEERIATIANPEVQVTAESFAAYFGVSTDNLPNVTISSALTVPAVTAAVTFLSRTLAALPLHLFKKSKSGAEKVEVGHTAETIYLRATPEMSAFKVRQFFWQQVFTGGRGLLWIEKRGADVVGLWPIDPRKVSVRRNGAKLSYVFESKVYPASEVIDIAFMLKEDMTRHYGPIVLASKAIQLALAMNTYAAGFFAGGGVPPLALTGPMPTGADAVKRATNEIWASVQAAKNSDRPVFAIPAGYELKPVGIDPAKGQLENARKMQIQEIARGWQLPPAFLQDLTGATFSNVEQQDLHLVKHLIGQWAKSLEDEMNLKLFASDEGLYVKHNLDALMRGDFKSRIDGLARAVQGGILTPNEARGLENRPRIETEAADQLHMQGATLPIDDLSGQTETETAPQDKATAPTDSGEADDSEE